LFVVSRHSRIIEELSARWPENRVAPSLGRIQALCDLLDDPQRSAPVIHIAGTNGKGSTAIMCDALLRAAGLRTGRFSSPHLIDITERVCIDGEPISEDEFDDNYERLRPYVQLVDAQAIDGVPMTFFEVITGLAFLIFADSPVDVMILEVGMGGAWDATNVADAAVAIITPIDLDHTHLLGNTIAEIATEKAGIIKLDSVVVVAEQQPEADEIIAARAALEGAELRRAGIDFDVVERAVAVGGQVLRLASGRTQIPDAFLPLHGVHMAHNAALAVAAVEALVGQSLDPDLVRDGLEAAYAPARLELVNTTPPVVVDTAHNPHGVRATLEGAAEAYGMDPLIVVLAMMRDKNVREVLELLDEVAHTLVVTQVSDNPRALPADELAALAGSILGADRVEMARDSSEALDIAMELAEDAGGVLVLGSVYLAGEIKERFA
jgi:dihydrofolate synthase/folylpolyglutamate synthase